MPRSEGRSQSRRHGLDPRPTQSRVLPLLFLHSAAALSSPHNVESKNRAPVRRPPFRGAVDRLGQDRPPGHWTAGPEDDTLAFICRLVGSGRLEPSAQVLGRQLTSNHAENTADY